MVDTYPKMARYIPTRKAVTAVRLANLFIYQIIGVFRLPAGIVPDRGRIFISQHWAEACCMAKGKLLLRTAFHHKDMGRLSVKTKLKLYLRCRVHTQHDDWAEFPSSDSQHPTLRKWPIFACYKFRSLALGPIQLRTPTFVLRTRSTIYMY